MYGCPKVSAGSGGILKDGCMATSSGEVDYSDAIPGVDRGLKTYPLHVRIELIYHTSTHAMVIVRISNRIWQGRAEVVT